MASVCLAIAELESFAEKQDLELPTKAMDELHAMKHVLEDYYLNKS